MRSQTLVLNAVLLFFACIALSSCGTSDTSEDGVAVNGVRNDVTMHIAALLDTDLQRASLNQSARALQNVLTVETASPGAMLDAINRISAAGSCRHARYESSIASKRGREIEKITMNTRAREATYQKFNQALNGTTFTLPRGDGCEN